MNTQIQPDYLLQNGRFCLNNAGHAAYERAQEAKAETARLARSWAGAYFARFFFSHAWLSSFELRISVYYETGDEGEQYRNCLLQVDKVIQVAGIQVTPEVLSGGEFDADLAADFLQAEFDDYGEEVFAAFFKESTSGELTLNVQRSALDTLLGAQEIEGTAAFAALFREWSV